MGEAPRLHPGTMIVVASPEPEPVDITERVATSVAIRR